MAHTMARSVSRSAPMAGGTMGGMAQPTGSRPGARQLVVHDGMYMWILVAMEVTLIAFLRSMFSRYHGG